MEIVIIFGLVLLNGIFAMAEMSLVSVRKFKLEVEKKKEGQVQKQLWNYPSPLPDFCQPSRLALH